MSGKNSPQQRTATARATVVLGRDILAALEQQEIQTKKRSRFPNRDPGGDHGGQKNLGTDPALSPLGPRQLSGRDPGGQRRGGLHRLYGQPDRPHGGGNGSANGCHRGSPHYLRYVQGPLPRHPDQRCETHAKNGWKKKTSPAPKNKTVNPWRN